MVKTYYRGIFQDPLLRKNIAHVHVINKNNATGTISDTSGYFIIRARAGDTLFVSAIGYDFELLPVDSTAWASGDTVAITLVPRAYTLPEVVIYELDTYEKFRKRFTEIRLEPEGFHIPGIPDIKPREVPRLLDPDYLKSAGFAVNSPVSFLYYNLSKREKNRRLYYELLQKQRLREMAEAKFGQEEFSAITGLQGDDLEDFIEFSGITPEMILRLTEYELRIRIRESMERYEKRMDH